jgi:hypothetical protein
MDNLRKTTKILIMILVLVCFGFALKTFTYAKNASSEVRSSKEMSNDAKKQNEKPLVVIEWEKTWGDLWQNEAKELKRKGMSDEEIIKRLNPLAAQRVSKIVNMHPDDVQRQVSEYYKISAKSK